MNNSTLSVTVSMVSVYTIDHGDGSVPYWDGINFVSHKNYCDGQIWFPYGQRCKRVCIMTSIYGIRGLISRPACVLYSAVAPTLFTIDMQQEFVI